jgi:histidinol-phosphatase
MRLADAADEITVGYVGRLAPAERKPDGSPVTAVDVAVEEALLRLVERERPGDAFLGEEVGAAGTGNPRWIVDGIDGTAAFVAGRAEWATLIGLESGGELVLGVASAPVLGRRWWATRGEGAWTAPLPMSAIARRTRIVVSDQKDLSAALVEGWAPPYQGRSDARVTIERLRMVARSGEDLPWATLRPPGQRPSWGSRHPGGALLVAAGLLDGFVMLGGGPWDHAAVALIVEEAGGRFSDIRGERKIDRGTAVFTNGAIHDDLIAGAFGARTRWRP